MKIKIGKNLRTECRFCEIIKKPLDYFDVIFYEDDICVIGRKNKQDVLCVYRKHGELPGGHNLYEMMNHLDKIKDKKKEQLQYVNHNHYRIYIRKKKGE